MNTKKYIWDFLDDLLANNSKDWMDEHRDSYLSAKQYWLDEVQAILDRLSQYDPTLELLAPSKTISRINNNRMFHPDKPIYKGHFSFSPGAKTDVITSVFIGMGPAFTMIGGGIYRPENAALKSIREAIDYDAEELLTIVRAPKFQKLFGGLALDPSQLKTAPKGYPKDHPSIELLRRKSFTASYTPTKSQVLKQHLPDVIEEAYLTLLPLNKWIEKALTV